MRLLLVINRQPYDETDVVWNALRLAGASLDKGLEVQLFLMNDGVDLARQGLAAGEDFDLQAMLLDLINRGVSVKLCQTCLTRCGISRGDVIPNAQAAGMKDLVGWIADAERVLTF